MKVLKVIKVLLGLKVRLDVKVGVVGAVGEVVKQLLGTKASSGAGHGPSRFSKGSWIRTRRFWKFLGSSGGRCCWVLRGGFCCCASWESVQQQPSRHTFGSMVSVPAAAVWVVSSFVSHVGML